MNKEETAYILMLIFIAVIGSTIILGEHSGRTAEEFCLEREGVR